MLPLWRNRDFVLFEVGRLLSNVGSQVSQLAYPLLVLALTHSPAKAGLVGFARALPPLLLALAAGVVADHGNRKRQMLASDALRALVLGTLAVLVATEHVEWWWIVPVCAALEGIGATFFSAAAVGATRGLVPAHQLPGAIGAQQARSSAAMLGGPPAGGALFQLGRSLPFFADFASYAASVGSLLLVRTPFQQPRERDDAPIRERLAEGFTYLWSRPFLRTSAFLYGLGNPLMPAILLVLVVVGRRQGLTGGEIGLLTAALGAAAFTGALLSPVARRLLPIRAIMLLEYLTWLGAWTFVVWPNVYVLLAVIVPFGIAAPITDSVVVGYRMAMTPDRLLGRVETVEDTIALALWPLGPLVAGVLLEHLSARSTMAAIAAFAMSLFVWAYLSPAIRNAPSLDELAVEGRAGTLGA
jgi:hypothetical protein